MRLGDDSVYPARLIAKLDPHLRRDVQPTVRIHGHAIGAAAGFAVGNVQVKITLWIGERSIRLDLVTVG